MSTLDMPSIRGPVAALPQEVYFEVTNRCNLLCETCPRTHNELEPPADLDYERMVEIADELPVIRRALLHGVGEPLLNPELPRMVAYFAGRGAHVVFNTNGILLDKRRGDAVSAAGLSELRVSFDAATPETFKVVRGADVLPKILRNVAAFTKRRAEVGGDGPSVSIWATALQENLHELPDLIRLSADLGVFRVHLQRLVFNGTGLAVAEQSVFRDLSLRQEEILAACRDAAAQVGVDLGGSGGTDGDGAFGGGAMDELAWQGCRRPWKVLYVTAQGTVLPCCMAPFATTDIPAISLGIVAEGVGNVWNGAAMRNFRTRHQTADPPVPCAPCGSQWSL